MESRGEIPWRFEALGRARVGAAGICLIAAAVAHVFLVAMLQGRRETSHSRSRRRNCQRKADQDGEHDANDGHDWLRPPSKRMGESRKMSTHVYSGRDHTCGNYVRDHNKLFWCVTGV